MRRRPVRAADGPARPRTAPGRHRRPATGRSFLTMIALACLATVLVVVWTLHSLSEQQGKRSVPAGFRM